MRLRGSTWALLTAGAILLVYEFLASRSTLWDEDEPRFSRATVEMVESGNYLYPTFNGELRPDKPILIYWLMSVPVRLFGPTPLACRFFAPVGVAATCLLTWWIGRRLFSERAGLAAMLMVAASPLMLIEGTMATVDAVMVACTTCAIAAFTLSATGGFRPWHAGLMALALGAALLTKGPVGLAVPVLSALAMLALGRRGTLKVGMRYLPWLAVAAAGGVLLFIAWGIPANVATNGEFLRQGIGTHVVERSAEPLEHHGGEFFLYLPCYPAVILLGFLPWTAFLPGALSALLGGRLGGRAGRAVLLGWMLATVVLMTIVSTKLPHYVLPIWPALALAAAAMLEAERAGSLTGRDRAWLRHGVWFGAPIVAAFGVGLLIYPHFVGIQGIRLPCAAMGVIVLAIAALCVREHLAGRYGRAAAAALGGTLAIMLGVSFALLPVIERSKAIPPFARAVNESVPADVPVAVHGVRNATLNFHLGRRLEYAVHEDDVAAWARKRGSGLLVIPRDQLKHVVNVCGPLGLSEVLSVEGFDWARGRRVELVALCRAGTPVRAPVQGRAY